MRKASIAALFISTMGTSMGAEPAPQSQPPLPALLDSISWMQESDAEGNTLLLNLAKAANEMPTASRKQLLDPIICELLRLGHDPLEENRLGCNAIFYLSGIHDLYKRLEAEKLLPRELSLRIPHDEGALLRYMRLRNKQLNLAKAGGSREYLVRRYCTPAYPRAERLLRSYMGAPSIARVPDNALADCLLFMRLANPTRASKFIDSLTYWEHGEHFLEEMPSNLLATLYQLNWEVAPAQLRRALEKLSTLLPVSKDDMIECAASVPMSRILDMLTRQEGLAAQPDLEKYAAAFDPEIVHTALLLQMKLQGLPYPGSEQFGQLTTPEVIEIRKALEADASIRQGSMEKLTAQQLREAAEILRKYNMPHHAEMMSGIIEGEQIQLRPELRPAFRTRYEELREESPHVSLLRYLLEHKELLLPGGEIES